MNILKKLIKKIVNKIGKYSDYYKYYKFVNNIEGDRGSYLVICPHPLYGVTKDSKRMKMREFIRYYKKYYNIPKVKDPVTGHWK